MTRRPFTGLQVLPQAVPLTNPTPRTEVMYITGMYGMAASLFQITEIISSAMRLNSVFNPSHA